MATKDGGFPKLPQTDRQWYCSIVHQLWHVPLSKPHMCVQTHYVWSHCQFWVGLAPGLCALSWEFFLRSTDSLPEAHGDVLCPDNNNLECAVIADSVPEKQKDSNLHWSRAVNLAVWTVIFLVFPKTFPFKKTPPRTSVWTDDATPARETEVPSGFMSCFHTVQKRGGTVQRERDGEGVGHKVTNVQTLI